jgi:hypothetical protein
MDIYKRLVPLFIVLLFLSACSGRSYDTFHDPNMEFASVHSVAVMPFENLTLEKLAAERVRDVFVTMLLTTEGVYVLPPGEVARGIARANIRKPEAPSPEEVVRFSGIIKADAVITGTVREYGEIRSGTTRANVISIGMKLMEAGSGKVVWSSSSTKGGVTMSDRLFGGGGRPINEITEEAVNDLIDKLFR